MGILYARVGGAWVPVSGSPVPPAWITLPLLNGWAGTDGSLPAQYRMIGDLVYLRFSLHWTNSSSNPLAILPVGYRPVRGAELLAGLMSEGGGPMTPFALRCTVSPDGSISVYGLTGTFGYVTLTQSFSLT